MFLAHFFSESGGLVLSYHRRQRWRPDLNGTVQMPKSWGIHSGRKEAARCNRAIGSLEFRSNNCDSPHAPRALPKNLVDLRSSLHCMAMT